MRGDITGTSGVAVISPDTSHAGGFFQDQEIIVTIFFQRNRHLKTTETRTYYYDFLPQWLIGIHVVRDIDALQNQRITS
jgi:hypothetical protein